MMTTRGSMIRPGFDCERGPCPSNGCPGYGSPGRPGGGHGIDGEDWRYWVVSDDGLMAVSLVVGTDIFPPTVPLDRRGRERPLADRRRGIDLTTHVGFPSELTSIPSWPPPDDATRHCDILPGGHCFSDDTTAIGADKFFRDHGDPAQHAQGEAFWVALENRLAERRAAFLPQRVDTTHQRCPTCSGKGYVPR